MPELPPKQPTTADYAAVKDERDRLLDNETKYRAALVAIYNDNPDSDQGRLAHEALQEAPK